MADKLGMMIKHVGCDIVHQNWHLCYIILVISHLETSTASTSSITMHFLTKSLSQNVKADQNNLKGKRAGNSNTFEVGMHMHSENVDRWWWNFQYSLLRENRWNGVATCSCQINLPLKLKTGFKLIRERYDKTKVSQSSWRAHFSKWSNLNKIKMSAIPVIDVTKIGLASSNPCTKDFEGKTPSVEYPALNWGYVN